MKTMTMKEIRDALLGKRISYEEFRLEWEYSFKIRCVFNGGLYITVYAEPDRSGFFINIMKTDIPALVKDGILKRTSLVFPEEATTTITLERVAS